MFEFEYDLGIDADVYNGLLSALPAGDNNLRKGIVVPAHSDQQPLTFIIKNVTPNIQHLVEVVGDWQTAPTPTSAFVPLTSLYTLTLALPYGPSVVTISNTEGEVSHFTVSSTNYAGIFRTLASEISTYATLPLQELVTSITSPLAYRLTLPLLKDASSLVPMLDVLSVLSYKLMVKSLLHTVGRDEAVHELLASISASNPILFKMDNMSLLDAPMYRSEETFSGWEAHVWLPNTELERWRAFIQLMSNMPQVFSLKQVNENEVYVEQGGRLRRHVFDPDSPKANRVDEGVQDCFRDLFKLSMTVEAEHTLSFCQATYFLDRFLAAVRTPDADPLGTKSFGQLSTSGRFEQQFGITPSVHRWKYEVLTGTDRFFNLSESPASNAAVKIFVDGLLRGLYKDYRFSSGSDFASSVYRLAGVAIESPILIDIPLADPRPFVAPVFSTLEVAGGANLQLFITHLEDSDLGHIKFVTSHAPALLPEDSENINIHFITPLLAQYSGSQYGQVSLQEGSTLVTLTYPIPASVIDYQLLCSLSVENHAPEDVGQITYLVRTHSLTGAVIEFSAPVGADTKLNYWLIEEDGVALERGTLAVSSGASELLLSFSNTYIDQVVVCLQLWNILDNSVEASHYLYSCMPLNPAGTVVKFSGPLDGDNYRLDYCVFPSQSGDHIEFYFPPEGIVEAHYDLNWPHWVNAGVLPAANGIQTEFLLPQPCENPKALYFTLNGRLMTDEQYVVTDLGTKVRFSFPPQLKQIPWAVYPVSGDNAPLTSSWEQGKLVRLPEMAGKYATGSISLDHELLAGDELSFRHKTSGNLEVFRAIPPASGYITADVLIEEGQCITFNRPAPVTLVGVYTTPIKSDEFLVGISQYDDTKSLVSCINNHPDLNSDYSSFWRGHTDLIHLAISDYESFAGIDNVIIAQKISPNETTLLTQFTLDFDSFSTISTSINFGKFALSIVGSSGVNCVYGNYAATSGGLSCLDTKAIKNYPELGSDVVLGVFSLGDSVFAATSGGLSLSRDRGNTWVTKSLGVVQSVYARDACIYAATSVGLQISLDDGETWTAIGTDNVTGVHAPTDAMIYASTLGHGLMLSDDGGMTWSYRSLPSNNIYGVFSVGSKVYAATDAGLSISDDNGNTWLTRTVLNGLASDKVNSVYVDGVVIYAATHAGLSISSDNGATWATKNLGIVRSVYVSVDIYAATADGLFISQDNGNTWQWINELALPVVPDLVNVLAVAAAPKQNGGWQEEGWDLSQYNLPIGGKQITFLLKDTVTHANCELRLNSGKTYYIVMSADMVSAVPDVRWKKSADSSGVFLSRSGHWSSQPFGMAYSIGAGLVEIRAKRLGAGSLNCTLSQQHIDETLTLVNGGDLHLVDITGDSTPSSYSNVTLFSNSRALSLTGEQVEPATDLFLAPEGHPFFDGLSVTVSGDLPSGLLINTIYNIADANSTSFKLTSSSGDYIDVTTTGGIFTIYGKDVDVDSSVFCAQDHGFSDNEAVLCIVPEGMGIVRGSTYYIKKLADNRFQLTNLAGGIIELLSDGGGESITIYSLGSIPATGVNAQDLVALSNEIDKNYIISSQYKTIGVPEDKIRIDLKVPDKAPDWDIIGSSVFNIQPVDLGQFYAKDTLYRAPALSYYAEAPVIALDGIMTHNYTEYEGDLVRFDFLPTVRQEGYCVTETFPVEYHKLDSTVANHDCHYPKGLFTQALSVGLSENSFSVVQEGKLVITKLDAPIQESPSGVIDGENASFTLSLKSGAGSSSLFVWLDGVFQPKDRWIYSQNTGGQGVITFNVPPTGRFLWVWYLSEGVYCLEDRTEIPTGVVDGSNCEFILADSWPDTQSLLVFVEGLFFTQGSEYQATTSGFTTFIAPAIGQSVWCHYNLGTSDVTNLWRQVDVGVCDGVKTSYIIPHTLSSQLPATSDSVLVFLDGINQRMGIDVSMASDPLTKYLTGEIRFLGGAPENNRKLSVAYIFEKDSVI